jgi:5-hydroxyisourate hydrolase-like protein (transthyretin family)
MNLFKRLLGIAALLALAACGGGGGSGGDNAFNPGSGSGGGGSGGGSGGSSGPPAQVPTVLTVAVAPATITGSTDGVVTVTLLDAERKGVPNTVVALSTQRGNLATLNVETALTDSNGVATARLRSAGTGAEGADELVATVGAGTAGGTASLSARAAFAVAAAAPTLALSPQGQAASTTTPLTITATLRRANGTPAANQRVEFKAGAGLARLSVAQAVTNAQGTATVVVTPQTPSTSGADVVTATATVDDRAVEGLTGVTLVAQAPDLSIVSVSNTVASASAPVTMRVVVRDLAGNLVPNALVSFTGALNLASYTPATAVTNALGEATTSIAPRTATSAGDELVTAGVTVGGVTVTRQRAINIVATAPAGSPTLDLALSTDSISAAAPATVTATLQDPLGAPIRSQLVTFAVVRGLAVTNVGTALTGANGVAQVLLSPASNVAAGADEITASVSFGGQQLQRTRGFQVQATPVQLTAFDSAASPLSAYGQTTLTLAVQGASVTAPVNISVSSACVAQGKATLSPATFTATTATVTMQYRDNGCGAVQAADQLNAVVTASGLSRALSLPIQTPAESSIAFVSAAPEQIFLRGSGFVESSIVTFEARDAAGNPLPNRAVELRLLTGSGGVTMEGRGVESVNPPSLNPFTLPSNAQGRVSVRVNSGTVPTPVRVHARLSGSGISTVSSNLSVAVGLPSQLNFSLSQGTINIEGYNIDGTPNTYSVIAADRSGNPVPEGTSINFVTEGGQVQAIRQIQSVNGIARTTANFVSSEPRPVDGRVTITAYALGEESFLDLNGNNAFDLNEPFQDLGSVHKDRRFNGVFNGTEDETIPLTLPGGAGNNLACVSSGNALLRLDASIPSQPATCDARWSGAGQVYVRRAIETVLSTSAGRPLWGSTAGLDAGCTARAITLQTGPESSQTASYIAVGGDTWYVGSGGSTMPFIVADANPGSAAISQLPRLNPMAAGTVVTATSPTQGVGVTVGGGSPVPSTSEATGASVVVQFNDPAVTSGVVFLTLRSPGGTGTTFTIPVQRGARPSGCPQ